MTCYSLLPQVFDLARVTIQFRSPITVGTGQGDDMVDSVCVTDANGLPAIPGTSIAGVLRHALAHGDPDHDPGIRHVFGYQDHDPRTGDSRGEPARLWTSWAHVHDQLDQPVPFRATQVRAQQLRDDPVVAALRAGVVRDHVRIGAQGVVAARGKFDEMLVPAGARFTFELGLAALEDEFKERFCLDSLLACLAAPFVRLGGRTRRGFGDFRLVSVLHRRFDLKVDRIAWSALPSDIAAGDPGGVLQPLDLRKLTAADAVRANSAEVVLEPEDFFLVGNGDVSGWCGAAAVTPESLTHVDVVPYTEPAIQWIDGRGEVGAQAEMVLPATSIKGALRHRVAFHARAMNGEWVGERHAWDVDLDNPALPLSDSGRRAVEALFGAAKDDEQGVPGRVFIPDIRLASPRSATLQHVSLDRFTGGPMDGMLFGEAVAWRGAQQGDVLSIRFKMWVERADELDGTAREAFRRAVEDMAQGRLALGAASSRGHGYFKGTVTWSDDWRAVQ